MDVLAPRGGFFPGPTHSFQDDIPTESYLYAAIGIAVCFAIGYTLSLLVPLKQKSLAGLTIYRSLAMGRGYCRGRAAA